MQIVGSSIDALMGAPILCAEEKG